MIRFQIWYCEIMQECLRILKPGGYILSFGSPRTYHRMACAIEDAGFEIRDQLQWIYGSGFPKSLNIGKAVDKLQGNEREIIGISNNGSGAQPSKLANHDKGDTGIGYMDGSGKTFKISKGTSEWEGWGTALKPANEPICLARKPLSEKTVAENVLKWGTGGLNIDGCRINSPKGNGVWGSSNKDCKPTFNDSKTVHEFKSEQHQLGRFPANVILDEEVGKLLDEQNPNAGACAPVKKGQNGKSKGIYGDYAQKGDDGDSFYDDKGGPSRFFYCPKTDREERNEGLEQFKTKQMLWSSGEQNPGSFQSENTNRSSQNNHPTVKPLKLIQYLQRLITPMGGITYDPFGGSGTSAIAANNEGFKWLLSEIVPEYCDIANKRIYHHGGLFQ